MMRPATPRVENEDQKPGEGGVEQVKLQMLLSGGGQEGPTIMDETKLFRHKGLIPPNSRFMGVWDWLTIMFLVFTAIVTPFEVAFVDTDLQSPLFWINRVVDLFFLSDMVLTLFIPYRNPETNTWVTDHKQIAVHYLKSWFLIDLISILPFDIIGVVIQSDEIQTIKVLRLLRLFRLVKLMRLFRTSRIISRWAPVVPIRYSVMSLIKFGIAMLLMAHWIACLLGIIPELEGTDFNWRVAYFENGLHYPPGSYSIWTTYLGGFYLASMTLTTIGYGDVVAKTDAERGIMLIVMFVGGGFYAFAIGNVFNIISSMDELTSEFHDTMDDLNDFMSAVKLPSSLQKKVRKYFHFSLYHKRAVNNTALMSYLTPSLKQVTAYIVNKSWIDQLPFLSSSVIGDERQLLVMLSELVQHRACGSNERILTKGETLTCLYVVERGAVLLHTSKLVDEAMQEEKISVHMYVQKTLDPVIRQELTTGTCFGHEVAYGFNTDMKALYNVTTLTYSELHYIEKDAMFKVIRKFPEAYQRLKAYAVRREWTRARVIPFADAEVPKATIDVGKLETEVTSLRTELEQLKRTLQEKDAKMRRLVG